MTKRTAPIGLGARAELRAWYLGQLRPRLVEAVAADVVRPGAVEDLDLLVTALFELPEPRFGAPGRQARSAQSVSP
jgi:hypothetical protein